jgi:hypothetical protein
MNDNINIIVSLRNKIAVDIVDSNKKNCKTVANFDQNKNIESKGMNEYFKS